MGWGYWTMGCMKKGLSEAKGTLTPMAAHVDEKECGTAAAKCAATDMKGTEKYGVFCSVSESFVM